MHLLKSCAAVGGLFLLLSLAAQGQGFAALVSPPRFELEGKPGKTLRSIIQVSNRSSTPGRYVFHTADWSFSPDFNVSFQDELKPGSCRPWVAIERPEVVVPGAGTLRYRFEVTPPADAPPGECRFAVMIEGADPSVTVNNGVRMPITGRIGVIVYVTISGGAPELEVLGPKVAMLNGRQLPALRVHNGGSAHGRMQGYLTGSDAKGIAYEFAPSDFPILPQEERDVFLTPSTASDEQPTLTFPVTVKGTLEWAGHKTEFSQRFE
jgi:hypothetical protein